MKIVFVIFILIAAGCVKRNLCSDTPLSVVKAAVDTAILRIDGYYVGPARVDSIGNKRRLLLVIYKDGTLFRAGNPLETEMDLYLANFYPENPERSTKYRWGVCSLVDDSIRIECWVPEKCGLPTVQMNGTATSDTSFRINRLTIRDGPSSKEEVIDETYIFRAFSPKPDSTNDFVL